MFEKCPSCDSNTPELLYSKGDLTHALINVVCPQCGLVYISPRPSATDFEGYQGESGMGSGHHAVVSKEEIEQRIEMRDIPLKKTVLAFLKPYLRNGIRILDIGCGFGTLLALARNEYEAKVTGIELNAQDVQVAKEKFGLDLFFGTFEKYANEHAREKFDSIILHHTFEHFLDPVSELGRIKNALADDGVLYIAVPNILNIKKRPDVFFIQGHFCTYSPYSMSRILRDHGFKVIAFNERAGYHGGMECVAAKNESHYNVLNARYDGGNVKKVKRYICCVEIKFKVLRFLRKTILFFVPASVRDNLSRRVYLWMKNLK